MLMSLYISPLLIVLSTINHLNYASYITFVNESINCLAMWAAHHIQSYLILHSKRACVFVFNLILFCYLKFKPSKYCLTEVLLNWIELIGKCLLAKNKSYTILPEPSMSTTNAHHVTSSAWLEPHMDPSYTWIWNYASLTWCLGIEWVSPPGLGQETDLDPYAKV